MSHIDEICGDSTDQQITDIRLLKKAAEGTCGLAFHEGQTTFRSWKDDHAGRLMGDYPVPEGWTADEIGENCAHAISLPPNEQTDQLSRYEIGVVQSRKFPGTFSLMYDFYGGRLDQRAGSKLSKLMQAYRAEAVKAAHQAMGDVVTQHVLPDGSIEIVADTTARIGA